ncbi:PKD domain-containing protein [Saprospiraceae bacterium]|nr:PKD domain-containing protein [Saprospiraceae bacterium]
MKNLIYILCISIMSSTAIYSQTADVTTGCAELQVQFTAPNSTSYFWDFGDNTFSDLQNPEHSYVQPGDYTVRLFNNQGGTQVGSSISITVYPEVEFIVSSNINQGCAPLEVNFRTIINAHPDLNITDIIWTFGDGSSGEGEMVNYTYRRPGTYSISLKVNTSNDVKCDNPKIFEDFITVEGANTGFTISREVICETPAEFFFTNETLNDEGATYLWDFGNGDTSTEENPPPYTYTTEGFYIIRLTTTTPAGCVTSFTKIVTVGSPIIDIPNTNLCLSAEQQINNLTIADEFLWDFSNTDIASSNLTDITAQQPIVSFPTSGEKTVTLTAISNSGCRTTETIIITVEDLNSNFNYDPVLTCQDSFLFTIQAEDTTMALYQWTNEVTGNNGTTTTDPNIELQFVHPVRDEFFFNGPDSIVTQLIVTSAAGCVDTTELSLALQKAEAIFIPDTDEACVPFTITFEDASFSGSEIDDRQWDFGDGSTLNLGSQDTIVEHTYNTPGEYTVTLFIKDEDGCEDISRDVLITIKEIPIDTLTPGGACPDCPGEPSDPSNPNATIYCVGDNYIFNNSATDRDIHIESMDGLLSTCWKGGTTNYTFTDPGPFFTAATVEIERVFVDSIFFPNPIEVLGSRSIIKYDASCDQPYDYTFDSSGSIEADRYTWFINNNIVSNEISFTHTFDATGDYNIYLETTRDIHSQCSPHRDSTIVHVRDVRADINIDDTFCDNIAYPLDAGGSVDAGRGPNCLSKYVWGFEEQRSVAAVEDIIEHKFIPGRQKVTLTAIDYNGCTHTDSTFINVYGIEPEFDLDSTLCLMSPVQLSDLTLSDTTLVTWDWNFGADSTDVQNPLYNFSAEDYDPNFSGDTITIRLIVEDAIGCVDTITETVSTYTITSIMDIDNGPKICAGEVINFSATDYTDNGSNLDFSWDFQTFGISEEREPSITFDENGEVLATLSYTEMSTGCTGSLDTLISVFNKPIAGFETDKDDLEVICFPEQIAFTNTSIEDGPVLYIWDFGNGATSSLENPVIPFDKGEWEVLFIVRSFFGCTDTITRNIELVGPEGTFSIDKTFICPGEEITLTLQDAVDINSFTWDLGNGVQIDDINPLTYTYNPESSITSFTPTLILRTNEGGCEDIQALPIMISSLEGDFDFTTGNCLGEVSFSSSFEGAQDYFWDIDGQIVEGNPNPSVSIMSDSDTIDVFLSVTDQNDCVIERRQRIAVPDLEGQVPLFPNVFSPNGDNINPTFNPVFDPTALNSEIVVSDFRVYNRWGELLYNNENPLGGWDGSYKGETVPSDVYAYFIQLDIDGCKSIRKKGNVTVIK